MSPRRVNHPRCDFLASDHSVLFSDRTSFRVSYLLVTDASLAFHLLVDDGRTDPLPIPARPVSRRRCFMSVDSYLELFTSLFGWAFYGVLWDVIVTTGIVYLPFLGILIDHWVEPLTEDGSSLASSTSLRRMEVDLFIALTIVVLAGQPAPLTPLNAHTLEYTPPASLTNPHPTPVKIDATGTTYGDKSFENWPNSITVPVWWYAVMSFSSGFNHAVVEGLPTASNIRNIAQTAQLATIDDPRLRSEVNDFYVSCYVPARSKFHQEKPSASLVQTIFDDYGPADVDWLGSHVYRTLPGYYDILRAKRPVEGWSYDPARDTEYDPASPPAYGRPYCTEWWAHPAHGLREKLVLSGGYTSVSFSQLVIIYATAMTDDEHRDVIAKAVLRNAPPVWSNNDFLVNNTERSSWLGGIERIARESATVAGTVVAASIFSLVVTVVLQAAPMIQAIVLLGIYALLPATMVLSRFSPSSMVTGAVGIFTVKFWTVLWYLALWVDQNLIEAMYPDVNTFLEFFVSPREQSTKRLILNLITTTLYVGLPILWTMMMAWAGVRIGRSIDSASAPYGGHARSSAQGAVGLANIAKF